MKRWGWTILFSLFVTPLEASPRVYFSSDQNVERPIIQAIDRAQFSIDAALYELTAPTLINAIRRASTRGIRIRLVLQKTGTGSRPMLLDPSLDITQTHWIGGLSQHGLMHHKFALVDGGMVITGSYNWTPGARHSNYENALFEDDSDVVRAYMRQFDLLWTRSEEAIPGTLRKVARPPSRPRHRKRRRLKRV